ncbi:MAG: DUF2232 domain-containing protein [Gammaproteobacteria bacterium]|nr:DUF2232 domain-containing protein [Gammaproteobacteria bacterium]
MQFLASLAMRGRAQAIMIAATLAMLSLVFPPASILSTAVVALVTLRQGPKEGALLMVFAGGACMVLAYLALGQAALVAGFVVVMWLPGWLLSNLLRSSRSLAITIQGGLLLGLSAIIWQYLQHDDPVATWREILEPLVHSMVESEMLSETHEQGLLDVMSQWMPGAMAAGFFLQTMVSVLLARWWQAVLFNPGGFRSEFHRLRMGRTLGVLTLLLLLPGLLNSEFSGAFADYIGLLLLAGWFLVGLALVHGMVGLLGANTGWLVAMYILLLFAMPHTATILALVGFIDAWFDFRARLRPKKGSGEAG